MANAPVISNNNLVRYFRWIVSLFNQYESSMDISSKQKAKLILRNSSVLLRGEAGAAVEAIPLDENGVYALEQSYLESIENLFPEERELFPQLRYIRDLLEELIAAIENSKQKVAEILNELRGIYNTPNSTGSGPLIAELMEKSRVGDSYKRHLYELANYLKPGYDHVKIFPLPEESARRSITAQITNVLDIVALQNEAMLEATQIVEKIKRPAVVHSVRQQGIEKISGINSITLKNLRKRGFNNVYDIIEKERKLENVEGVGKITARKISRGAKLIYNDVARRLTLQLDPESLSRDKVRLLAVVNAAITVQRNRPTGLQMENWSKLRTLFETKTVECLVWESPTGELERIVQQSIAELESFDTLFGKISDYTTQLSAKNFLSKHSAEIYSYLISIGVLHEDEQKTQGFIDKTLADEIKGLTLYLDKLNATLRPYQEFGTRYILNQKRVLIGDEMGLGKTLQSIAAMQHLSELGNTHFLVICPLPVLVNWQREVERFSSLNAYKLHGKDASWAKKEWMKSGGVAITTYESVRNLKLNYSMGEKFQGEGQARPALVVVDEAHFIKNPNTIRTRAVLSYIRPAEYLIMLSGTPLENNLNEFRTLLGYAQSDLSITASDDQPQKFREQIGPVYLRRNREDVLKELPKLIDQYEWIDFSDEDMEYYKAAVEVGSWHDMRRAALLAKEESSKIQRLKEIAEDAKHNGRKMLIFTYYRESLSVIEEVMRPYNCYTPIHGGIAATDRQGIIDDYSEDPKSAVLIAQISSGGTGLNIQAASVVVIVEPQVKPSIEEQAISRAYRMGQANVVTVHRLNSAESIDERMVEILKGKDKLAQDFSKVSEAAKLDDSIVISESSSVEIGSKTIKNFIAEERERLGIITKPLGSDPNFDPEEFNKYSF